MESLEEDIHPATGYLVSHPTGETGKLVKELVRFTCSKSPEMSAVYHSRAMRTTTCAWYTQRLLQTRAPAALLAAIVSYVSYRVFDDGTASTVGFPFRLTFTTQILVTVLLFGGVYLVALPLFRFLAHLSAVNASTQRLKATEDLLLRETERAVERGVVALLTARPVRARRRREEDDVSNAILRIRGLSFAYILKRGHINALYRHVLQTLIMRADEDLARVLRAFQEDIDRPLAIMDP